MSTFDSNFPAKGNPKMSDRVFGFDSENLKNAGITNQALYDLFKGELDPTLPKIGDFLPAFDLSNARVMTSTTPDNKLVKSNVLDPNTGQYVTFKEIDYTPSVIDGRIFVQSAGKTFKRVIKEYKLEDFGISEGKTGAENASIFNYAQTVIENNSLVSLASGNYNLNNSTITKSGVYDFSGVTINNNQELEGSAIKIESSAEFVNIVGLNLIYSGIFYRSTSNGYVGTLGVTKYGISTSNKRTICNSVRVKGFTHAGFWGELENESMYLVTCVSSNNGYAGAFSRGKDFQVIGGEYNENGGSNAVNDGYGVYGNISTRGNFKVIGATVQRNATRNIDSHQGHDIIIIGNQTEDAGIGLPQWFNKVSTDGLNIRVTQRIDKAIISGNICKRGTLAGISISGDVADHYLRNIIINDNILEDNLQQIFIRQLETNKLDISGNQCSNPSGNVQWDLLVNPYTDTEDRCYLKDFKLCNNSFDSPSYITLSNHAGSIHKSTITMNGNTFPVLTVALNSIETIFNISSNTLESLSIIGGDTKSVLNFQGNVMDKQGGTSAFTFNGTFNGRSLIINNVFQNGAATTLYTVPQNTDFINNKFTNYSVGGTGIRCIVGNARIIGNSFDSPNLLTNPLRFTATPNLVVKDNYFTGNARVDHSGGSKIAPNYVLFDPIEGLYDLDFNTSTLPDLGDFAFKRGDQMRNRMTTSNAPIGLVCSTAGVPGTWIPFGRIGADIGKLLSGNTTNRPTVTTTGYSYFDTSLGKPIWWNGTVWKDATGLTV